VDEDAEKRRSMEQLEDNLVATAVEITKEDRERVDEGHLPGGLPCSLLRSRDFAPHRFRW
jgi:hypothetical protein